MKVSNMTSNNGNKVANQFIVNTGMNKELNGKLYHSVEFFQSYNSVIVLTGVEYETGKTQVFIDPYYWDYSRTTGRYRNQFLNETKQETQSKIDSGEYILLDLNK